MVHLLNKEPSKLATEYFSYVSNMFQNGHTGLILNILVSLLMILAAASVILFSPFRSHFFESNGAIYSIRKSTFLFPKRVSVTFFRS